MFEVEGLSKLKSQISKDIFCHEILKKFSEGPVAGFRKIWMDAMDCRKCFWDLLKKKKTIWKQNNGFLKNFF